MLPGVSCQGTGIDKEVKMKQMVLGYCGVDCAECKVLIATKKNDDTLRQEYADYLLAAYGVQVPAENINCSGCVRGTVEGTALFGHCLGCAVRQCAGGRGVRTCADCAEYACGKLTEKWGEFPAGLKAKENLPR
jgi:anthranilate/para-aminobenzoate synthase component II